MSDELTALAKAIELKTGYSQNIIESIFENVAVFGYQISMRHKHSGIQFRRSDNVRVIPRYLDKDAYLTPSPFPMGEDD